jgi:hypothetical protein
VLFIFNFDNTKNLIVPHKTTNNKMPQSNDKITKKKLDLFENHSCMLKEGKKDVEGRFYAKNDIKSPIFYE